MIATLSFFYRKYPYPLYRFNGVMIHQPLSPDAVHPQISSSLRVLIDCLVRPDLFVINYCFFYFFKEPISFNTSLDKYQTIVFNALITLGDGGWGGGGRLVGRGEAFQSYRSGQRMSLLCQTLA